MRPRRIAPALLVWLIASPLLAAVSGEQPGQDVPVPAAVQYALLTKILVYDRKLEAPGGELVVAIAYQSNHVASRTLMEQLTAAAKDAGAVTVRGNPLRVVAIDIGTGDQLMEQLARESASVVYFTPLRAVNVNDLAKGASKGGVLTITGVPDYMRRAVCVGFAQKDGRPLILINLGASRASGTDFSAQLLQRAEIVDR
jgi:hypothetical protein